MTPQEFKDARNRLGLSMQQAADILRVSKQTLAKWEAPPTAASSAPASPLACAAMRWFLDGFRPPEWPEYLAAGKDGRYPKKKEGAD